MFMALISLIASGMGARQITEEFPWDVAPLYLIRDRDRIYGAAVTRRLRAMGIRDKPIATGSHYWGREIEALGHTVRLIALYM
jgi:hypothetical protein